MEQPDSDISYDKQFVRNMVESSLRIALIAILLWLTFDIVRPFLVPLVWGAIIAIAAYPLAQALGARIGNRNGLAAGLVSLTFILLLVLPSYQLTESLISAVGKLAQNLEAGTLEVPPPPEGVSEWPLIGERLYEEWSLASTNLEALLVDTGPKLRGLVSGLCAIGLFALGVPGAPIWAAVILFLAIAQLPLIVIILPMVLWAYSSHDTTSATLFAVWMVLAALSDNVLKPLLMGRGLDVPMPVILIGAIGGMIALGIIGLFADAVVLSIWYKLFREWLMQEAR